MPLPLFVHSIQLNKPPLHSPSPPVSGSPADHPVDPAARAEAVQRGLDLCRKGLWKEGLRLLAEIVENAESGSGLPGRLYSYLGYGIAREERRIQEGLRLCQHAIKIEFYQAENYLNLARTLLLADRKGAAVRAVRDGLAIDPKNRELLVLRRELGVRKAPVLSFLDRTNPLNILLGRLRYRLRQKK